MDDTTIIKQVAAGNWQAFSELIQRYEQGIIGFLRSFGIDRMQCEDAAQQVFLKAFSSCQNFDMTKGTFATWLFTIAKHHALDAIKDDLLLAGDYGNAGINAPRGATLASENATDPEIMRLMQLEAALEQVPEKHRNTLCLTFYKYLSIKEIAAIEGISESTVKSRVHRAKQILLEQLFAEGEEDKR